MPAFSYKEILGIFVGTTCFLALSVILFFSYNDTQTLTVAFLDVGQGDSIYIEAPNGNQVLIDGGPDRSVLAQLGKQMRFYDRSLDLVIGTHPDKDHIGGLLNIVQDYQVLGYMSPGIIADTGLAEALEKLITEKDVQHIFAERGMRIFLDKRTGVFMDVLYPDHDVSQISDKNEGSIITRLVYGETSFVFTGDAGVSVERDLVREVSDVLDSDILKLGHHGSRTSTSKEFLQATTPEIAIISAGNDNRYGHPHEQVLANLREFSIPYLGTYEEGMIVFESDGKNIFVK